MYLEIGCHHWMPTVTTVFSYKSTPFTYLNLSAVRFIKEMNQVHIWIHQPNKYTPPVSAPSEATPLKFLDEMKLIKLITLIMLPPLPPLPSPTCCPVIVCNMPSLQIGYYSILLHVSIWAHSVSSFTELVLCMSIRLFSPLLPCK